MRATVNAYLKNHNKQVTTQSPKKAVTLLRSVHDSIVRDQLTKAVLSCAV